jgi:hypothetical protein
MFMQLLVASPKRERSLKRLRWHAKSDKLKHEIIVSEREPNETFEIVRLSWLLLDELAKWHAHKDDIPLFSDCSYLRSSL